MIKTNPRTDVLSPDLELARSLFGSGDYAAALEQAYTLTTTGNATPVRIAALLLTASAESEMARYADSLGTLTTIEVLIEHGSPRQQAHFYGQRANVKRKLGDKDAALIDYEAARHWATISEDALTEARIRNNLAKLYSEFDRFDEATEESDAAIAAAKQAKDDFLLGRFYDQRAQILIDSGMYSEALRYSEQAIQLLQGYPAVVEARTTHGTALIGQGGQFLECGDEFATFKAKHHAVALIRVALDKELVQRALEKTGGRVKIAADMLGVRHSAIVKFAKQHSLERRPEWRRQRTISKK